MKRLRLNQLRISYMNIVIPSGLASAWVGLLLVQQRLSKVASNEAARGAFAMAKWRDDMA